MPVWLVRTRIGPLRARVCLSAAGPLAALPPLPVSALLARHSHCSQSPSGTSGGMCLSSLLVEGAVTGQFLGLARFLLVSLHPQQARPANSPGGVWLHTLPQGHGAP